MLPHLGTSFPDVEILIRNGEELRVPPESDLTAAPEGWQDTHGVIMPG